MTAADQSDEDATAAQPFLSPPQQQESHKCTVKIVGGYAGTAPRLSHRGSVHRYSRSSMSRRHSIERKLKEKADLKAVVGACAGNVLEYFDFSLFGYFADVIGRVFFNAEDEHQQLIMSFSVFAAAFFVRPIGKFVLHIRRCLKNSVFFVVCVCLFFFFVNNFRHLNLIAGII